jgi:hypothetical protein
MANANDTGPAWATPETPAMSATSTAVTRRRLQKACAALACIAVAIEYNVETDVADAVTLVFEQIERTIAGFETCDRTPQARIVVEGLREAAAQCTEAQGALRERLTGAAALLEELAAAS